MMWVMDVIVLFLWVGYLVGWLLGCVVICNYVWWWICSIVREIAREGWLPNGLYLIGVCLGIE